MKLTDLLSDINIIAALSGFPVSTALTPNGPQMAAVPGNGQGCLRPAHNTELIIPQFQKCAIRNCETLRGESPPQRGLSII